MASIDPNSVSGISGVPEPKPDTDASKDKASAASPVADTASKADKSASPTLGGSPSSASSVESSISRSAIPPSSTPPPSPPTPSLSSRTSTSTSSTSAGTPSSSRSSSPSASASRASAATPPPSPPTSRSSSPSPSSSSPTAATSSPAPRRRSLLEKIKAGAASLWRSNEPHFDAVSSAQGLRVAQDLLNRVRISTATPAPTSLSEPLIYSHPSSVSLSELRRQRDAIRSTIEKRVSEAYEKARAANPAASAIEPEGLGIDSAALAREIDSTGGISPEVIEGFKRAHCAFRNAQAALHRTASEGPARQTALENKGRAEKEKNVAIANMNREIEDIVQRKAGGRTETISRVDTEFYRDALRENLSIKGQQITHGEAGEQAELHMFFQKLISEYTPVGFSNLSLLLSQSLPADISVHLKTNAEETLHPSASGIFGINNLEKMQYNIEERDGNVVIILDLKMQVWELNREGDERLPIKNVAIRREVTINKQELMSHSIDTDGRAPNVISVRDTYLDLPIR